MSNDTAEQLLGTTLADTYIIDSTLGEGGMGRVFLARHTRIAAKRFAVKVLHEEFAQHTEALERFKREAEATASITSPHVIGVHDVGTTPDGRPFIASDFLEGEELADRLEREGGQLPVPEAVRIVRQVLSGLAAAHKQGVIHRDIKPENVFLVRGAEESSVKLLDFGISRLTDQNVKALTLAGIALGTPDFMSPEQARGKPVDHRSDVYAAGVLLYVMITSVSPFERESPQETLMALLMEDAPSPSTFQDNLPPHLVAIIEKAISKEVDARYQSANELFQALAPFDPTVSDVSQAIPPVAMHHAATSPVATPSAPEPTPIQVPVPMASHAAAPLVPVSPTLTGGDELPPVLIYGGLGLGAVFLGLWLAVGGILRAAEVRITLGGWLIVALLLAIAIAVPGVLTLRHVNKTQTSRRGPNQARALRSAVVTGCAVYGALSMLVRILQIVILSDPRNVSWPIYDVLLFLVAMIAAGLAAATELQRPH